MGREVRMVPPNWQHPRDSDGEYIPQYDLSFEEAVQQWTEGFLQWINGTHPDILRDATRQTRFVFWEWEEPPQRETYRSEVWPEEGRTHYQMYETCTQGTPISPVCASPEELARWLFENKASTFGSHTTSYEKWLAMIHRGSCCSLEMTPFGIVSGVDAVGMRKSLHQKR